MFCTLNVFSLKMNLFYKIYLQAFNIIFIVLYQSGPAFGQVSHPCLDGFVVDVSDYSGHLIRHILNASEAFPTEWFLQFWEQSKSGGLSPTDPRILPRERLYARGAIFTKFLQKNKKGNSEEQLEFLLDFRNERTCFVP
jgi:hypothetical protein